jgi:hypothetical protein
LRAIGFAVLLSLAGGAAAQEIRREHHAANIPAGREGRIAYFASPDERCGKGIAPEITVLERPSYGRLSQRPDRLVASPSTIPPRASACRGEFVDVTAVYYKPAPGFHGSDRVVLRVHFPARDGDAATAVHEIYVSVR